MFLTAVNAFAYSGACVIWGQPNGQYLPIPYAGDSTGFGRARDACIVRGGGVITIGPGCDNVVTTYPNGAGILVIKVFGTGWVADPMSLSVTTFANLRIARLGPTSSAGVGGAVRIIEGSTFAQTGAGIQAAHDDLPATGGLIIVTEGTYNYTSTINITKSNVTIQGLGRGSKLVNNHSTGVDAFLISGSNVRVMNIFIDGVNSSKTEGEGVHITGANVDITGCYIENTPDYGIHFHTGSSNGSASNNFISNVGDAGTVEGAGIVVHDGNDYRIINNQINTSRTYGVYVQGTASKVVVEGNLIKASIVDGVLADSTAKYVSIVGNNIQDSGASGITADSDSTIVADNLVARVGQTAIGFGIWAKARANGSSWWGNHVVDPDDYGIAWHPDATVTHAAGLSIFSNFIANSNGFGIDIFAPASCGISDIMIGNNYIIGTGQSQSGIRIQTNATSNGIRRVHILGNVIKNSVDDGIEIVSGGTVGIQDLYITENQILNNTDDGIVFTAAGVASTAFVSDNVLTGNGTNTLDVGANWSISNFAERFTQASIAVVEDTLRLNNTATFRRNGTAGDIVMSTSGDLIDFTKNGIITIKASHASGSIRFETSTNPVPLIDIQSDGVVEILGGKFRHSDVSSDITGHYSATATLDFDLSGVPCQDLTIAVSAAQLGDTVVVGTPNGSVTTDTFFTAWVSVAGTVTVRACRVSGTPNPASGTFRVDVWDH